MENYVPDDLYLKLKNLNIKEKPPNDKLSIEIKKNEVPINVSKNRVFPPYQGPSSENNLVEIFKKELYKKKTLLRTANINSLPDRGEKIKSQIANLEAQIAKLQSKENAHINSAIAGGGIGLQKHEAIKLDSKSSCGNSQINEKNKLVEKHFQIKGPNGEIKLVKVGQGQNPKPAMINQMPVSCQSIASSLVKDQHTTGSKNLISHMTSEFGQYVKPNHTPCQGIKPNTIPYHNLKPNSETKQIPASGQKIMKNSVTSHVPSVIKQPQIKNYIPILPSSSSVKAQPLDNKGQAEHILKNPFYYPSRAAIPIQPQALPPHVLKQMYQAHPQMQTLYDGRITEAQKREAQLITSEAIEKLHKSLHTCPSEEEKENDPSGLTVNLLPHQKHALKWMLWRETQSPPGGILADDMGLGKTLTTLALIMKSRELNLTNVKLDNADCKDLILTKATLVVCPASIVHQWEKEAKQRIASGKIKMLMFHGPNRLKDANKLANYDIVFTTYSIVLNEIAGEVKEIEASDSGKKKSPKKGSMPLFLSVVWDRIILDEAHTIKNPKSQTAVALCKLRAARRWALTGTPINNDLMDMYSLLRFLRCTPFDEQKVWKRWVDNKSLEGQKRLNTLIKTLMLRRTKNQLTKGGTPLMVLPSKQLHLINLTLSTEEREIYDKIFDLSRSKFMQYLAQQEKKKDKVEMQSAHNFETSPDSETLRGSQMLLLLLRLRQCCSHLHLIKGKIDVETHQIENIDANLSDQLAGLSLQEKEKSSEDPSELKSVINKSSENNPLFDIDHRSSKLQCLLNKLKEFHSPNKSSKVKSVIVSQWTSMLDIIGVHLKKANYGYHIIRGEMTPKKRAAVVDDFNSNPEGPEVLLLSLRAGGVGLNLIGGSQLFLVDLHWNPQLELQAYDRIHRVGQKRDVHIFRIVCQNTIEDRIVALQERKLSLAKNVYQGNDNRQKLTLDDMKLLFNISK